MTGSIPDNLLPNLNEFLTSKMGLHFPKNRWRELKRKISEAAKEHDFEDVEEYIHWLLSEPLTKGQIELLASHLTIGETYFYREPRSFKVLEQSILPELIHSRRKTEKRLRIWSAGCCTGEEPYSIAILLNKLIPDLKEWNITILATDINPDFLKKGKEGIYASWSFRNTPQWVKKGYFTIKDKDRLKINTHIKKIVTFSHLNLADDVYPSLLNNTNAMDIIFIGYPVWSTK